MKPQTSGCMRRVWSRNRPRSGGIVASSPSRCSSTEAPAPGGWTPCETWASWSGSPSRTRLRAAVADRERVGERDLAGLVDEEVVERLVACPRGEQPGGAGDQLHVAGVGKSPLSSEFSISGSSSSDSNCVVRAAGLLQAAELGAAPRRELLDLVRAGCGSPCGCSTVTPTRLPRASRWTIRCAPV